MGLASLPAKGVMAKILSVVALGGGGAQAPVHSHRLPQAPAIHEAVARPSTPARAHATGQTTASSAPAAAAPEVSAASPASSPPTTAHVPAPDASAAATSS